jgi:metal-responsive CopG/Arc/MetJ family transcriptional regulator
MKTAISIPDDVFAFAEQFAKRQHISRSELYTRAVSEYVEEHKTLRVREKLDEIYSAEKPGHVDPTVSKLQSRAVREDW